MHESTLARRVLELACAAAEKAGGGRVRSVHGQIAETETLSVDALQFHFDALALGTLAEGAKLTFQVEHVAARCRACDAMYLPEHHILLCPECGSTEATVLGLPGMRITSVEVDECPGSD